GLRQQAPPDDLPRLRRRCLGLGPGSVMVSLWGWVAAGIIFPVTLQLTVPDQVSFGFHLHFLLSQTLFGLIAVTYPQFGVTGLAYYLTTLIRADVAALLDLAEPRP